MTEPPRTCKACPSFLKAEDTPSAFKTTVGSPMCARFGYVLGRPNLTPAGEDEICKVRAKDCPAYMQPRPPIPVETKHEVAFIDTIKYGKPGEGVGREMVGSCLACKNYAPENVVVDAFGWPTGMCTVKGTLVLKNRLNYEGRDCDWRTYGQPRSEVTGVQLLPEFDTAFVLTGSKNDVAVYLAEKRNQVDPTEYPSDTEVQPHEAANGIRAWRRVHDPEDPERHVFLPIYDPGHFASELRALVPQTGSDEHPEDYADHMNLTYKCAVLWVALDETPALWGIAGTGKTEFFRYMAWLMQLPFTRFSFTGSTELDDMAGKMHLRDGKTVFEYGRLPRAWTRPNVMVLDEPNAAPPDVWQWIRPLTDNSKQLAMDMNEGEILPRHDDCYLGMAMNPAWDIRNVGANNIADADGSRLAHFEMELPSEGIEREIMRKRCEHDGYEIKDATLATIMRIAKEVRALSDEGTIPISWGIRQQIKVARATRWFSLLSAVKMAAADYLEPDARDTILEVVKAHVES